jgi:hypothetical protein
MPIKPTPADAILRLRLDDSLDGDISNAIDQAHAQAVAFMDGALYEDAAARDAAADLRGIICTPDIIAAQLLLVDVLVGNNSAQDRELKEAGAFNMLRLHRNMGA